MGFTSPNGAEAGAGTPAPHQDFGDKIGSLAGSQLPLTSGLLSAVFGHGSPQPSVDPHGSMASAPLLGLGGTEPAPVSMPSVAQPPHSGLLPALLKLFM